ncbi:MAG TPA: PhoU domain-containing protein [Methanoregulaceae archaeon]|nr:PhoU domain-containing protein [Methanoregulaceae archaeon]HPD75978.1 PhoU domain-containing protein [Methanoregulaceae archaeon]
MEIRKVQVTGGSSFVVTLPKEWAEQQKLKKNDPVGILIQPDGSLLVSRKINEEPVQRIKEIDASTITEPAYLFRLLIGTYITGFNLVRITAKNKLQPFVRTVVRDYIRMTIGQEVVDETEQGITIKDLLNPSEMPFENTIKRMYVIVRAMHEDALAAFTACDRTLAQDVIQRDMDADRLNWLVSRQTNMILQNSNLSRKMGITMGVAMHYAQLSRIIERIGDHAVRISENALPLMACDIDPKIKTALREASSLSLKLFDRSIVSFFNSNIKDAHRTIEAIAELEEACTRINNMALTQETAVAISVGYMAESIRRSGEYAADISENVINFLVEGDFPARKARPGK